MAVAQLVVRVVSLFMGLIPGSFCQSVDGQTNTLHVIAACCHDCVCVRERVDE